MTSNTVRARPPRGRVELPRALEVPEPRLVDAAYFPGGRADALYAPASEGEIAAVLRAHDRVLAVGAQSSLTGGATPAGGALVAMERLDALSVDATSRTALCGAGVVLSRLQAEARLRGLFCAPAPTFDGATLGGMASTNAAGAATFKYGTMRRAVRAITVVLADGSVLDLRGGACVAASDGTFRIVRLDGTVATVQVPTYRDPAVPKVSAGYHAAAGMDLVDLFVGSEGTLGVVTEVVVELTPLPPALWTCWLPCASDDDAVLATAALRSSARAAWEGDADETDVASIESMDRRCLELLRQERIDRTHGVPLGEDVGAALLFTVEVADETRAAETLQRVLAEEIERLEIAQTPAQAARFLALREAVPTAVNHRVRDARLRDPGVTKVAGDFCVPFEQLHVSLRRYRDAFARRGLDCAVWGHASDGNLHPNALPRSAADVAAGKEALLELADWVISVGGSPLAEHGVGRSPVKQEMLRRLRGDRGIEEMRAVKRALDPGGKLAPGVVFPA